MGKQEIERLRELREPYACMAASHEGEAEGAKFAEIVAALDRAIAIAEAWEVAPEFYVSGVIDCEDGKVGEITRSIPPEFIGERVRLVRSGRGGDES